MRDEGRGTRDEFESFSSWLFHSRPFVPGPRPSSLVPRPSSHRSTRKRRDPDRTGLHPKTRPMIDDEPLLVLPLMHHLVQQRVQRLLPPVAPDVPAAQDDLRLAAFARRTVVAESALHPAGDADRDLAESAVEPIFVVRVVEAEQLANQRLICWVGSLRRASPSRRIDGPRHREFKNRPTRFVAHHARPPVHERYDRLPHFLVSAEEAVVDAQLSAAVADNDGAICCQAHAVLPAESQALETRPQFFRVFWRRLVQLQRQLIAITQPPHTPIA